MKNFLFLAILSTVVFLLAFNMPPLVNALLAATASVIIARLIMKLNASKRTPATGSTRNIYA